MTIEQFIRTQIETVDNLCTLLLLRSEPQTVWDSVAVSSRLHLRLEDVERVLEELAAKGLIGVTTGPRYHYLPKTPEFVPLIEELARIDREQPVSLINLIYAQPEHVKAFADAFRRKNE